MRILGLLVAVLCAVHTACGATFTVTTTLDAGPGSLPPGSLREAILAANATPGEDDIVFAIVTPAPHSIALLAALPTITDPVNIDASTQPGFTGTPLVELSGASAGAGVSGLRIAAGGSTVRGLIINRFSGAGILLETNGHNVIVGNFIGTDRFGTSAANNGLGISLNRSSTNDIGLPFGGRNVISGNSGHGILLQSANFNAIAGNFVGVDVTGNGRLGNGSDAIHLAGGSTSNRVGGVTAGAGNILANSPGFGIFLSQSPGNVMEGNTIGTDAQGLNAMPNRLCGITCAQSGMNRIGGLEPGSRNLISGNGVHGIEINGAASAGNIVQGNWIGTDASGSGAIPNGSAGVFISAGPFNVIGGLQGSAGNVIAGNAGSGVQIVFALSNAVMANFIGVRHDGVGALGNMTGIELSHSSYTAIGASDAGGRNVVSGNRSFGISIAGASSDNVIEGNHVGVDLLGMLAVPNSSDGIYIEAPRNTIGGQQQQQRNVISGNLRSGIRIVGSGATGNVVQGNFIGTDITGKQRLSNRGDGIWIRSSANIIGGTEFGAGNRIAFNEQGNGVRVSDASATGNSIAGNSIWANDYLGINLDASNTVQDPVSANDANDTDIGPNRLQNFPVLTNVVYTGATLTVEGFIATTANRSIHIDFYANESFDASGHGEGEQYLGRTTVITDGAGSRQFSFTVMNVVSNQYVTATATDGLTGDTSEFSAAIGGLRITRIDRNGDVTFTTYAGRNHRLEYTTALGASPTWQTVAGAASVSGTGGKVTVNDPAVGGMRFYRVLLLP